MVSNIQEKIPVSVADIQAGMHRVEVNGTVFFTRNNNEVCRPRSWARELSLYSPFFSPFDVIPGPGLLLSKRSSQFSLVESRMIAIVSVNSSAPNGGTWTQYGATIWPFSPSTNHFERVHGPNELIVCREHRECA